MYNEFDDDVDEFEDENDEECSDRCVCAIEEDEDEDVNDDGYDDEDAIYEDRMSGLDEDDVYEMDEYF